MDRTGDRALYPPDGNVDFLRRWGHQVKMRGIRIGPGEIEAVRCGHPSAREAVAGARDESSGSKQLVAYVVAEGAPTPAHPKRREGVR